jgi:hypothetical protein
MCLIGICLIRSAMKMRTSPHFGMGIIGFFRWGYLYVQVGWRIPPAMVICFVPRIGEYFSTVTWFDQGEYFQDPDQVRTYFKVEVMEALYPGWSKKTGLTHTDLDEIAGALIHHKWYCIF